MRHSKTANLKLRGKNKPKLCAVVNNVTRFFWLLNFPRFLIAVLFLLHSGSPYYLPFRCSPLSKYYSVPTSTRAIIRPMITTSLLSHDWSVLQFRTIYVSQEPSRNRVVVPACQCWNFKQSMGLGTEFSHPPASLCSLAARYGNFISTQFLAPIDCSKIPALATWLVELISWNPSLCSWKV